MIAVEDMKIAGYTLAVIVVFTIAAAMTPAAATVLTLPVCVALILPCALHLQRRRSRRSKRDRARPA